VTKAYSHYTTRLMWTQRRKSKALGQQPKSKPSSQARVIKTLKGPSSVKTNRPTATATTSLRCTWR